MSLILYNVQFSKHTILIGPHKTGTTALQAFIYDQVDKGGAIFTFDNIRIPKYEELPGVFGKEGIMLNLPHCSLEKYKASGGQMLSPMCDRMRSAFPKFMHDAYNKSEDVLFVAEDFDRIAINNERLHFYLRPYKKIKVVVMYRRLHEWLPSFYNQIMQHYNLVYAKGEEEYPSFVAWLNEHYDEFLDVHAIRVAERYRSQHWVTTVDIINMHEVAETSNLIEYFFCNALDAEATCQAIRDGARPPKSNIGADHDYERLAVKASLGGKISAKFTKPIHLVKATRSLVMKVNEMNAVDTLPRICPSKQLLDQILATEIEHEKTYFPEWFTSHGGEEGLQQSFDKAVKKKFCSLDADKIIESGMLDSVFKELA